MALVKATNTTSPTLNPTLGGGGLEALTYSTPGQHVAAPGELPSSISAPGCTGQGWQVAAEVAAGVALNCPALQGVQATAWPTLQ